MKAAVFKNRRGQEWLAHRPRYGFTPGIEVKIFRAHSSALRWALREDGFSSSGCPERAGSDDTDHPVVGWGWKQS